MILVKFDCATCPQHLRLLVATKVEDDGRPTTDVDMGDLMSKVAGRGWSLTGPLCRECAEKMRKIVN